MNYQKPVIITQDNIAEGIYTASGEKNHCESAYMNGSYQRPTEGWVEGQTYTYSTIACRSCPADQNWTCAVADGNTYMNQTLKPKWEVNGHAASDTFVCTAGFNSFNPE